MTVVSLGYLNVGPPRKTRWSNSSGNHGCIEIERARLHEWHSDCLPVLPVLGCLRTLVPSYTKNHCEKLNMWHLEILEIKQQHGVVAFQITVLFNKFPLRDLFSLSRACQWQLLRHWLFNYKAQHSCKPSAWVIEINTTRCASILNYLTSCRRQNGSLSKPLSWIRLKKSSLYNSATWRLDFGLLA